MQLGDVIRMAKVILRRKEQETSAAQVACKQQWKGTRTSTSSLFAAEKRQGNLDTRTRMEPISDRATELDHHLGI